MELIVAMMVAVSAEVSLIFSAAYVLFLAILGPFLTRAVASRQGKMLRPGEV